MPIGHFDFLCQTRLGTKTLSWYSVINDRIWVSVNYYYNILTNQHRSVKKETLNKGMACFLQDKKAKQDKHKTYSILSANF